MASVRGNVYVFDAPFTGSGEATTAVNLTERQRAFLLALLTGTRVFVRDTDTVSDIAGIVRALSVGNDGK